MMTELRQSLYNKSHDDDDDDDGEDNGSFDARHKKKLLDQSKNKNSA